MLHMSDWTWQQLHGSDQYHEKNSAPGPRELPGGLLWSPDDNSLVVFGGGTAKYGIPERQGDLTKMGALNDVWQYQIAESRWELIEPDSDAAVAPSVTETRAVGRMLPVWTPLHGTYYLFGGLTVTGAGWQPLLTNDMWTFDLHAQKWTMIQPSDVFTPDGGSHHSATYNKLRPAPVGAVGSAVVGDYLFIFGGWLSDHSISDELWSYHAPSNEWTQHRLRTKQAAWPRRRYVASLTAYDGALYLWGGRDTHGGANEFFNDMWQYNLDSGVWICLHPSWTADAAAPPSPRYGHGAARVGTQWFVFGGFGSMHGNGPQLNDLYVYDLSKAGHGKWKCLQEHDGAKDYSARATRPGVRRVPGMTVSEDSIFLFGGIDLASGPHNDGPLIAVSDFWRGRNDRMSSGGAKL